MSKASSKARFAQTEQAKSNTAFDLFSLQLSPLAQQPNTELNLARNGEEADDLAHFDENVRNAIRLARNKDP